MAEQRRCLVSRPYDTPLEGSLIQFGTDVYHDDGSQTHSIPIAVIELDDGQVIKVDPARIQFVK